MSDTANDTTVRVLVEAENLDAIRDFTRETDADTGCRPAARRTSAGYASDMYVLQSRVAAARVAGVTVTVVEDADAVGRARQAEVASGNRFAARGAVPRGLGIKE